MKKIVFLLLFLPVFALAQSATIEQMMLDSFYAHQQMRLDSLQIEGDSLKVS